MLNLVHKSVVRYRFMLHLADRYLRYSFQHHFPCIWEDLLDFLLILTVELIMYTRLCPWAFYSVLETQYQNI